MRPRPACSLDSRKSRALVAFLTALLLSAGCRQAPSTDLGPLPASLLHANPDTPGILPAPSPLFAAVVAPAPPPAQRVEAAPLPARPPDAGQVARQAVSPIAPPAAAPGAAGLVVCDPAPASPELAAFGSGCGRWLDVVAAGQPELGRTPEWEARWRVRQEMGRKDFCLGPAQAGALAAMTGATHAAFGTLTGTAARCTLTYRLYALPAGTPSGPPLTQSGSEAQIVAALPAMARALDARLGVVAPRLPASVGLSPVDLTTLAKIASQTSPTDADLLTLAGLSARSPVAGMDYLDTRAAYDQVLLTRMVKTLLTQLPGNALVLEHIGYSQPAALRPYAAATQVLISGHPSSALLAHTEVWQQRIWGTRAGELKASQRVVSDAPSEPDAWLTLSYTLGSVSEDLRQSRVAGDIPAADWATLDRLYPRMEAACLRATALDPRDGHAWARLAMTATFASDAGRAVDALRQALTLDPSKLEVYDWGLQMYQPKWGGDAASLSRIAGLAAAEPWDNSQDATGAAEALRSAGFDTQADAVLAGFITRERARIAVAPADALAHWGLAAALAAQDTSATLRGASLEYRTAAHLMPNSPVIHRCLGDVLDRRQRQGEAIPEYRKAIALDPFDWEAHFDLGYDLKHARQFPEALAEMHLAMCLNPRNAAVHYGLGELLTMQHRYGPAAAEYRETIRMAYYSLDAWGALTNALDQCGRYDDSLAVGAEANHVLTEQGQADSEAEATVRNTMADDYLQRKEWDRSIAECQAALGTNPNDAWAHENLAEAYIGEGHKAEAQAEWGKVISLGNPVMTPIARKLLAAHP